MSAKKRIFIGSSTPEIDLARQAREVLKEDFDVTIWNEKLWDPGVFRINDNFFSDLMKASLKFDFGILIGTADDKLIYKDKEVMQPRDNVLFELGLFIGRLGVSKCTFVVEKQLKVLSDLEGITLARFSKSDPASFIDAIHQAKDFFIHSEDNEINFFPSATLAATYFNNLIFPVCDYLISNKGFVYNGKKHPNILLKIVIPGTIAKDVNLKFEELKGKFSTKSVSFKYKGRPRNINMDTQIKNDVLEFIDFPTIVSGINYAIAKLLPDLDPSGSEYGLIVERELNKFVGTLRHDIRENGFDKYVAFIKESEI